MSTGTQGEFSWGGSTGNQLRGDEFTLGTGYVHMNTARGHLQDHQVIVLEIGHARRSHRPAPEVYGYGAWGTYSARGIGAARTLTGSDAVSDQIEVTADTFGVMPDSTLDDASAARGMSGSARWTGLLLRADTASDAFAPVTGDAMLNVDLETLDGTAAFDLTTSLMISCLDFRT